MNMNGFIRAQGGGRFGNCIFRYLASRLFCILYNYQIVKDHIPGMIQFHDSMFKEWKDQILNNNTLAKLNNSYLSFDMY